MPRSVSSFSRTPGEFRLSLGSPSLDQERSLALERNNDGSGSGATVTVTASDFHILPPQRDRGWGASGIEAVLPPPPVLEKKAETGFSVGGGVVDEGRG